MPKRPETLATPRDFEILERATAYQGYFRVERYRVRYRRYDGAWSEPAWREVFERGHAAAVIPYDPVRDEVVLIEQFRIGAADAAGGAWMLEPVAGIIEPGEAVEDVARRETLEEAGLDILDLYPVMTYLASPGGTTESVAVYIGRVDAAQAGGTFGLANESEDILAFALPLNEAMDAMMARPIKVAALLIGLQWLTLNHNEIRTAWNGPRSGEVTA